VYPAGRERFFFKLTLSGTNAKAKDDEELLQKSWHYAKKTTTTTTTAYSFKLFKDI
jgi:hypothetical protein